MDEDLGVFPFGRRDAIRPMRRPHDCDARVLGVYPSAFHVAWTPPPENDPRPTERRARPLISSLAVDVEPTVFWNGLDPSPDVLLAEWRAAVGFEDERHGNVRPGHNGPSGAGLANVVLGPLGLDPDRVAFTDAVPWFFVKHERGGQAEAINERFNPIADQLGITPRPAPTETPIRRLVAIATTDEQRDKLRHDVRSSAAELVITLGNEALAVLHGIADIVTNLSTSLTPETYGRRRHSTYRRHTPSGASTVPPGLPTPNQGSSLEDDARSVAARPTRNSRRLGT